LRSVQLAADTFHLPRLFDSPQVPITLEAIDQGMRVFDGLSRCYSPLRVARLRPRHSEISMQTPVMASSLTMIKKALNFCRSHVIHYGRRKDTDPGVRKKACVAYEHPVRYKIQSEGMGSVVCMDLVKHPIGVGTVLLNYR
jgi:hypothetical protein